MNYQIDELFNDILESINEIIVSDVYTTKDSIPEIKEIIEAWYKEYNTKKTLKTITVTNLEFINEKIIDFFDKYIMIESTKENYAERLSFYWSILLHKWKDEMLGEN